jgi:hypothetical protein
MLVELMKENMELGEIIMLISFVKFGKEYEGA